MPLFSFDEEALSGSLSHASVEDEARPREDESRLARPTGTGRRRSSVYHRVSIKSGSVGAETELVIPQGYDNSQHPTKKRLQDFTPIKVLGQGAYGKVYLVQDAATGKLFAQKQLRKPTISRVADDARHASEVARTLSEREVLTRITHHPNVVKLFYALQDRDKFYLILEYLPGGELFHHLTSAHNTLGNAFREDDVAFYAAQMALALRHLHGLGIVYRDLKPENCLLNAEGHLVLTDFGLSKTVDAGECTSIIGTPEYMAPEVLRGEHYDQRVDWWSLGCVIFDMMSGKPPFTGNSHRAIQEQIIRAKLKVPFYFSLDAKDLLAKLLNKNPAKRLDVDAKWDAFTRHRFFRKLDWARLDATVPPVVPKITDPILAENFSDEFTGLKLSMRGADASSPQANFEGFSYTAPDSFLSRYT
ncbi:Serine/threonine-protein kinase psk1 [[Candida] zeylanoides]